METIKGNQIIYKEDLAKDPDLFDYIKDQLDSNVGGKILNSLINNGISICEADTKADQLLDINAVNIMDTVRITKLIRCKDCKNWHTDWTPICADFTPEDHYCAMIDLVTEGDFFCGYAERKEDHV